MDDTTNRTPHPEDPAEGAVESTATDRGDTRPPHSEAPAEGADPSAGGTWLGDDEPAPGDETAAPQPDAAGGTWLGDDEPGLGGDERTASQLGADNEVENDSLKTLDPDDPPA